MQAPRVEKVVISVGVGKMIKEKGKLELAEAQLRRARSGTADAVLFSVLGAVQDFAGACPQADDMSLVVVRRRSARGNG